MATETYSLEQFMADLDRITSEDTSAEVVTQRIAPLLSRLVKNPDAIPLQYRRRPPDGRRGRRRGRKTPGEPEVSELLGVRRATLARD